MSDRYAGGAAFPGPSFTENGYSSGHDMGMSLRDWFAGQIVAGWCANPNLIPNPKTTPEAAYDLADAMLAERDRDRDPV